MRQHWTLDPDIVFLNHGAFGACPRAVLDVQSEWRARLEREPVHFFANVLEAEFDRLREIVGAFVGARPEDIAFIRNSTAGVSAVLRSLDFGPGDVLLTTDHAYNACKNALDFKAQHCGASVRVVKIPFPPVSPEDVTERILAAATPGTGVRLAMIDHVTSPTGLVLPIDDIVRRLRERGIETLVDGAHGPGMRPLELSKLGAAYYVGNFHKWLCAPKGAAMLWAREDRQRGLHPPVISHGFNSSRSRSRFLEEFDWTGSDDPSSWLAVPAAIRFLGGLLPGGWPEVYRHNRQLVLEGRRILVDALGLAADVPESMIGALATMRLPDGDSKVFVPPNLEPLHLTLFERHRIEVPVFSWPDAPKRLVRISAHLYNTVDDYRKLAGALAHELGLERAG